MWIPPTPRFIQALAVAATIVFPAAAFAQNVVGVDDAMRRDLIAQAEAARDAGEHARAVDLATRAAQLRMTPSLALLLGQEQSELGHLAIALDHARHCATDAAVDATLRNRARIERLCTELTRELDGRVARLTVRVPEGVLGAVVDVSGRVLPPATWGAAIPVDPGEVTVRATTPDGRRFERVTRLAEGARVEVAVVFTTPPFNAATPPMSTVHPAPRERREHSAVGAGPWIVAGLGAVALGTAGVLWSMHEGAISDRDAACIPRGCYPSSIDANDRAHGFTLATNISLAVGGVALAAGITWFVIARTRTHGDAPAVRPAAWVMPDSAGVTIGGTL